MRFPAIQRRRLHCKVTGPVRIVAAFCVLLVMGGLLPEAALACPTCKNALHASGNLALAYASSITLLLAAPFSILGMWIWYIVRLTRRGVLPK